MQQHGGRLQAVAATILALALACATPAIADFPGTDPAESPRLNTPNDPGFDECEPDDPAPPAEQNDGEEDCTSYWREQYGLFGFRADSARDLLGRPLEYANCDQLDAEGRAANQAVGDPECSVISGVRADTAWKYSAGDPGVKVAIMDNGIKWDSTDLIEKVALNTHELPKPQGSDSYDANGDGRVSVSDWKADPRVAKTAGDTESDAVLDASDLIATFSDGKDDDGNGYVDDIAGWDFFQDDNDPLDSSACCQNGHGSGRAREAVADTDNGSGGAGMCPRCSLVPLRTSDDIVHDTNLVGMATVYAADNGVAVTEGALGGLLNTSFARRAFAYADRKGVAQMMVSSDINSANHNFPTTYNEAIYVGGALPDTAPSDRCETPGLPFLVDGEAIPGCEQLLELLNENGVTTPSGQLPTTSFFRNANLTQYGGKADIVLMGSTGSENTGQSAGAAALLESYGRKVLGGDRPLSGNEIRQLLTMTAEDVLPENTGMIGLPDKASPGWDPHFGYGRVNLAGAMRRISERRIPPEVQLDAPDWFAPIDVDRAGDAGVAVRGRVVSGHFDGVRWRLDYACGQDPVESDFKVLASGEGDQDGELGRIPKPLLDDLADNCDGQVRNDPGRPAGTQAQPWPQDPYPDPDPERHAFQLRLKAWQAGDEANQGQYRKTLFAYRDDGTLSGWPKPVGPGEDRDLLRTGSGGEASPRLADLDGDNRLDVVLPTSSGELYVLGADGRPLPSWNGGSPVRTMPYAVARAHGAGGVGDPGPLEALRTPAIGDITGDGDPEVVVTAGEHLYAWSRDGTPVPGFPQRLDPRFSAPCKPGVAPPCFDAAKRNLSRQLHLKRGFTGSPALADLDGDGRLDVVVGALDQRVYAWSGEGESLPGFPVRVDSGSPDDGAEIFTSPSIADLDGDGRPEIVIATNEIVGDAPGFDPDDLFSFFTGQATGFSVTYALHGNGKPMAGWPVKTGVLAGDLLPLVIPSNDAAVADVDPTRKGDEVSIAAGTGGAKLVAGDGDVIKSYTSQPTPASRLTDRSTVVNVADYAAIGRLADPDGPTVVKGGLTLLGAANLLASNQNLPFNHAVQAWNPLTGDYRPGWPVATDDWEVASQPTIARVGGDGGGRQALVGTGLYQLHAYGADGTEPAGWPKFTGGWLQASASVGDVDGDGALDVVTLTREGWAFAWRTGVPACAAAGATTNDEWWTLHHDEHGSGNYGQDSRPPSRPANLRVQELRGGTARLTFDGSGDDMDCGSAARYEVAGSDEPIRDGADFARAKRLDAGPAARSAAAGDDVTLTVPDGSRFNQLAVRAVDNAGNRSFVAGEVGGRTVSPGERPVAGGEPAEQPAGKPAAGGSGSLPFTGLGLAGLLALGLLLALAGRRLRR